MSAVEIDAVDAERLTLERKAATTPHPTSATVYRRALIPTGAYLTFPSHRLIITFSKHTSFGANVVNWMSKALSSMQTHKNTM